MRRKRRRRNRYRLIPLTSFVIFLVCIALSGISEPDINENVSLNLPSAPDLVRDIAETGLPSEVMAEAEAIKEISVESENDTEVFIQNLTDFDIDMAALLKNDSRATNGRYDRLGLWNCPRKQKIARGPVC